MRCRAPALALATSADGSEIGFSTVGDSATGRAGDAIVVDRAGNVPMTPTSIGSILSLAWPSLHEERRPATGRRRPRLFVAVGFGDGLEPALLVLALDRTPAGTVSLFLNLELVATA